LATEVSFVLEHKGRPPIYGDIIVPVPRGSLDRQRYPVVVISHGFLGHKEWGFLPFLSRRSVELGYAAIRFNFSHSGVIPPAKAINRPDLFKLNLIKYEIEDYSVLFGALGAGDLPLSERLDISSCAIVGYSRGGATALLFASSSKYEDKSARVKSLCSIGALSDWNFYSTGFSRALKASGVIEIEYPNDEGKLVLGSENIEDLEMHADDYDIKRAAGRIGIPWLIIHGENDGTVPVDHAKHLFEHSDQHLSRLEIIEGASHCFGANGSSAQERDQHLSRLEIIEGASHCFGANGSSAQERVEVHRVGGLIFDFLNIHM